MRNPLMAKDQSTPLWPERPDRTAGEAGAVVPDDPDDAQAPEAVEGTEIPPFEELCVVSRRLGIPPAADSWHQ